MIVPEAAVTVTVNDTVWPVVPGGSVPMFQVTTPPAKVPPFVAETNVVPVGTGSLMITLAALAPPVLPW